MLYYDDGLADYLLHADFKRSGDTVLTLTSPTGEIYRYVLESENHTLRELTDLNQWVIIPRLQQIPSRRVQDPAGQQPQRPPRPSEQQRAQSQSCDIGMILLHASSNAADCAP